MNGDLLLELIRLAPSILWIVFTMILVAVFYKPIRHELLPRLGNLKVPGFEATFVRGELDKAVEKQKVRVEERERGRVLERAQRIAPLLQQAQVLWVDDNQENNIFERRVLHRFGVLVDQVRSTKEAMLMLARVQYDVVISDIARDGVENEGLRFLEVMRQQKLFRPIIFYVGQIDRDKSVPAYAFGITNRPDQLLHYVMDVIERER